MSERLRPRDVAILAAESPTTPMHNATLEIFDPGDSGFDHDRLVELIADRIAFVPRYRQRARGHEVVQPRGSWPAARGGVVAGFAPRHRQHRERDDEGGDGPGDRQLGRDREVLGAAEAVRRDRAAQRTSSWSTIWSGSWLSTSTTPGRSIVISCSEVPSS